MPPPVVLVVEDNALLRMEASDPLKDAGYDVLEAENSIAAIAVLEKHHGISLLFTDIDMPGGPDGLDLAAEVHQRWPDVLLLVTSGGITMKDEELPDDGRFVSKPYTPSTLIEQVRGLIAKGRRPA